MATGQPGSRPPGSPWSRRLPVWQIVISLIKPVLWTGAAVIILVGGVLELTIDNVPEAVGRTSRRRALGVVRLPVLQTLGPPVPRLTNYPGVRCGGGARRAGTPAPRPGEVNSGAAANGPYQAQE